MQRRALLQAGLSLAATTAAPLLAPLWARAGSAARPAPLKRGSRIACVAPGTWLDGDQRWLDLLQQRCQAQGWELVRPGALRKRWRWFAGSDAERAKALQTAWRDPTIDALFYVGAGWGSARVLAQGWPLPPQPRWCVGFSDCSALLLAQLAAGSNGGIHGWFGSDPEPWDRLVALLQHQPVPPLQGQPLSQGVVEGRLVVTNLTVATSLIGTPWLPDLKGCVLVLEDTGEAPYRVDRQLTQWISSGLLEGVAGFGLGRFSWAEDDVLPGDFSMDEILAERLVPLGRPIVRQLPLGHGRPNQPLPLGVMARLDGSRGRLSVLSE